MAQPPPPTPRPPEPGDRQDAAVNKADSVPVAEPLPGQMFGVATDSAGHRPSPVCTFPRGASSGGTAAGTTKASPPGSGTSRSQEIQFDPQGMITTHINELDVRQLLELISRRSGMNILVSPKVTGTITANFEKVTIQELLKLGPQAREPRQRRPKVDVHFIYSQGRAQRRGRDR